MARFLALDWDAGHVHLLAATLGKGGVRLERALAWPEELPPALSNADAFGQRLRDRLKEAGVAPAPLMIAVGRDRLILKEVRYPAVPAHEEPGVVRFQAVKELTDGAEDVILDYQASDTPEPSGERKALAVALRRDLMQAYQAIAKAAGVKLIAVTPRAFGTLASLRRSASQVPEPGTAFAALTVGERGGEFAVARGENLMFARALSGPAIASDAALLGEIRRNLAVYAGQATQNPVRALYVAEAEGLTLGVGDRIRDTLAIPVYRFDPLAGLEPPTGSTVGAFAGAAGLFHLYSHNRVMPVNFVKPREPKPPRDPNRRVMVMAASIVGLLALGAGAWGYTKLKAKDEEARGLVAEKADYDKLLSESLKQDQMRIDALDAWTGSGVVLLDELYNLAADFPSPTALQVSKLEATALAHKPGAKDKSVVRIKLEGQRTADPSPLNQLWNKLRADGYKVKAPKVTENRAGAQQGRFAQQWTMSYDLAKRPPGKYESVFTHAIPPRSNNNNNRQPQAQPAIDFNQFFGGMVP